MSETLFIADLHLDPQRPATTGLFCSFLQQRAAQADALYILGDFLELWVGDDDRLDPGVQAALEQLKQVAAERSVYLMHGNRDFLIGADFAERYGLTLLEEPCVVDLYDRPTLLVHGDTLCTDDVAYQQFRQMVRNPAWQADFLAKPLAERHAMVAAVRQRSRSETSLKPADIMDVNATAVAQAMQAAGVQMLIHGHTHRPAIHQWDGKARIVLGDWGECGWVLSCREDIWELQRFDEERLETVDQLTFCNGQDRTRMRGQDSLPQRHKAHRE